MSEKSKEMQRFLEEVAANSGLSEKLAVALKKLDFDQIAALAQEAGFRVSLEDLLRDFNSVKEIQPLCDEQAATVVGGSGLFTQCLLDLELLKIVDPASYKICAKGRH